MLQFLLSVSAETDKEKVVYMYDNFQKDMLCFAKNRLRNADVINYELEAEDIVQESFLRITRYIHDIDFSLGQAANKAYVFSIMCNVLQDYLRQRKFFESMENCENVEDDGEDFIETLNLHEEYNEVRQAVDELDEIYRIVLLLYYDQNMTTQQIADAMEIPVSTVQTRLFRARQILRVKLEGTHG